MLFATLILDREPMRWEELPRAFMTWVQNVGGLCALGGLIVVVAALVQQRVEKGRLQVNRLALAALFLSWLGFAASILLNTANWMSGGTLSHLLPTQVPQVTAADLEPPRMPTLTLGDWLLTIAGALALLTVAAPLLAALPGRLRWRRIWAMARLSFKEAIRSRVVLIFGAMIPVFLFAAWFIPYKPEDQVRNYVFLLYVSMVILFFMTSSLLGALGIPTDVKSQAIHTIVTKPVEKFEIVLGRFVGYAVLVTIGLAVVGAASMLYMVRGITDEAKQESYTARVPLYGKLDYVGTKDKRGENVGRVYDIRGYITGPSPTAPNQARQYGVWSFDALPSGLGADGKPLQVQFGFDIFRLTKGVENQGVLCTFLFADGRLSPAEFERAKEKVRRDFDQMREAALKKSAGDDKVFQRELETINQKLIETYGIVVKSGFNAVDYHTQSIEVPAALFQYLEKLEKSEPRQALTGETRPPMFQVAVTVDYDPRGQNQQMLGISRRDLYLLVAEKSFFVNFFKGIIGIWCLMMLVLGLAVACSTYLSGIISWLCTIFLLGAGFFVNYVQDVIENRPNTGGGPVEAAYRLATKMPVAGQLDEGPTASVISGIDDVWRFLLRFVRDLLPDVSHYNLRNYVANGFDISWSQVLLLDNLVPLVGYLLPCALLAFYLMRYREIANPS
jgi:hypothetical protein